MDIKFLGQGFESTSDNSVGNNLLSLFKKGTYHSFTAISAFISLAGINGLAISINAERDKFKKITVITGVDQKGTSKEALEALLALGIESYVFYQPSVSIFHPKIYLFEGDKNAELIIGSSNLTAQGLFVNVEASLFISIDLSLKEDAVLLKQLKDYYGGLFDVSDPNLLALDDLLIDNLVKSNVVPTEPERRRMYVKKQDDATKDLIESIFPKREISKIPAIFRVTARPTTTATSGVASLSTVSVAATAIPAIAPPRGQLVWIKRSLPSSSVQVSATGTNPTGGLRLVQDKYTVRGVRIDQTTYFRNLFSGYTWTTVRATPFVESATVPFELTIRGIYIGKFNLDVRHKPSGDAGQNNYTTSISWGSAVSHIQGQNLTGLQLELYEPLVRAGAFQIVIS